MFNIKYFIIYMAYSKKKYGKNTKSQKYKKRKHTKKIKSIKYKGGDNKNYDYSPYYINSNWPTNYGCKATPELIILEKESIIDRFGGIKGNYTGVPTDSFESRSLPIFKIGREKDVTVNRLLNDADAYVKYSKEMYHKYKLLKNIFVLKCIAAPAFGYGGGAIQYLFPNIRDKKFYDNIYNNYNEKDNVNFEEFYEKTDKIDPNKYFKKIDRQLNTNQPLEDDTQNNKIINNDTMFFTIEYLLDNKIIKEVVDNTYPPFIKQIQ